MKQSTRALSLVPALLACAISSACGGRGERASQEERHRVKETHSTGSDGGAEPQATSVDPASGAPGFVPLFPHIRADMQRKIVEFDAEISPMLVDDPDAPHFFLEVLICTPDTREHETLLVTRARPSHIHAALLAVGLEPGAPGGWRRDDNALVPIPPRGDAARVWFRYETSEPDGGFTLTTVDPMDWVVNVRTGKHMHEAAGSEQPDASRWLFAGSRTPTRPEAAPPGAAAIRYEADATGQVLGLHTFGSEVLAWPQVMSPQAEVLEPEWIADIPKIPPPGTAVRVRVEKAK